MVRWEVLGRHVQLAISEMKISFSKILGHFNFQLRYPNRSNSSSLISPHSWSGREVTGERNTKTPLSIDQTTTLWNFMPYSSRMVCGFFNVPQNLYLRVMRRDLRLIVLIREDLKV